jgi:hypothetical protein
MKDRVRIDALTGWRVEDTARRENRGTPEALAILVADGYRARRPAMPESPDSSLTDDLTDSSATRGKTIAFHAKPTTITGLKRFAEANNRSLSSAIQFLVSEGLRCHGPAPADANKIDAINTGRVEAPSET